MEVTEDMFQQQWNDGVPTSIGDQENISLAESSAQLLLRKDWHWLLLTETQSKIFSRDWWLNTSLLLKSSICRCIHLGTSKQCTEVTIHFWECWLLTVSKCIFQKKKCCIYYVYFQSSEEAYTGGVVFAEVVLNHSEILLKVIMLCRIIWTRREEKPAGQNSRISIQIKTNTFQFPNEDDCAPVCEYLLEISRDGEISWCEISEIRWCLHVCFWNPCPICPCCWTTTRKVLHKPAFYIFCMVLWGVYVHHYCFLQ